LAFGIRICYYTQSITPVDDLVTFSECAYSAAAGAHAVVVMTEWDEFKVH
jgi:hypothetical protein